jgi:hypothetical protein
MKGKMLITVLMIPVLLLSTLSTSAVTQKVMWGKTELKLGQIGKVTIVSPTPIYQYNPDHILSKLNRTLNKNEEYRVYSFKELDAGYYGLGSGLFVKKSNTVKYETPSRSKLALLEQQSHPELAGKVYPDGWVAPVLKSAWSPNHATNFKTLQNELGFTGDGHFFNIQEESQAIEVSGDSGENEVTIKFYLWNAPSMEQGYRIPVVAKELFKLYFGNDATRVWNYFNTGNIPDHFTANGRSVKATAIDLEGSLYLYVGRNNNSNDS